MWGWAQVCILAVSVFVLVTGKCHINYRHITPVCMVACLTLLKCWVIIF